MKTNEDLLDELMAVVLEEIGVKLDMYDELATTIRQALRELAESKHLRAAAWRRNTYGG